MPTYAANCRFIPLNVIDWGVVFRLSSRSTFARHAYTLPAGLSRLIKHTGITKILLLKDC